MPHMNPEHEGTQERADRERILVVEDNKLLWDVIAGSVGTEPWDPTFVESGEEALARFGQHPELLDLVILDLGLPGMSGFAVLDCLHQADPGLPVVIMTSQTDAQSAVRCMKSGAYDYLTKPFTQEAFQSYVGRALKVRALYRRCAFFESGDSLEEKMGPSREVQRLVEQVRQVAPTNMSVLIQGESGTGKELVAHRIHALSRRHQGPFIAVDCGAIPETLLEAELFGFRKGSFTGASSDRQGRFLAAQNGTLFLDEVGNFPQLMQAKVLRVLQEKEVTPIGSNHPVPVDVRLVSAANESLERKVAAGQCRVDFFHRINEFPIQISPIRERAEDLLYLCARFARQASTEFVKQIQGFSEEALKQALTYSWPGNVRELQSVIRRAVLSTQGQIERLPLQMQTPPFASRVTRTESDGCTVIHAQAVILREAIKRGHVPFKQILKDLVREVERGILENVVEEVGGNVSQAARILGLDFKTVHTKTRDNSIRRKEDHG